MLGRDGSSAVPGGDGKEWLVVEGRNGQGGDGLSFGSGCCVRGWLVELSSVRREVVRRTGRASAWHVSKCGKGRPGKSDG